MTPSTAHDLCTLITQGISALAALAVGFPSFTLHCLGSLVASTPEISVTGRDIVNVTL